MVNQEYFNSLVNGLQTEEGKIIAIVKAVMKGETNNNDHIKTALNYLENKGEYSDAAEVYEIIGNFEYAIRELEEALETVKNVGLGNTGATLRGIYQSKLAVLIKKKKEDENKSKEFYENALRNFEEAGRFDFAADLAEDFEDFQKAKNYKALDKLLNPKCD